MWLTDRFKLLALRLTTAKPLLNNPNGPGLMMLWRIAGYDSGNLRNPTLSMTGWIGNKYRHLVENVFARLKHFGAIARG